jgi:hypothetical protein
MLDCHIPKCEKFGMQNKINKSVELFGFDVISQRKKIF